MDKEIAKRLGLESAYRPTGWPAKCGPKSKCLARVKIAQTSAGPASLTVLDLSRFRTPDLCVRGDAQPLTPAFVAGVRWRVSGLHATAGSGKRDRSAIDNMGKQKTRLSLAISDLSRFLLLESRG